MADLALVQMARNDADDLAAIGQGGIRHQAHEANAPAAIDQADAVLCEDAARADGGSPVGLVDLSRCAAIDADTLDQSHASLPFEPQHARKRRPGSSAQSAAFWCRQT